MKLYVLYEQTCDGDYNHKYFLSEDKQMKIFTKRNVNVERKIMKAIGK